MSTIGNLIVALATDASEYKKGLNEAESETKSWGGRIGAVAKNAVTGVGVAVAGVAVSAGAALAGIGVAGINSFVGFQGQMNEVFTLLPGISQAAMDAMSEDVKDFAEEFGTLPEEVVPALYQSLSAGVPPDNVFAFLETAQAAATGGVTDLATAVDGISSVVNAYGSDIVNAAQASDAMFTAVRLGKTNFGELSSSLFNVIPTASALGVQFGDVTAGLAAITAQGTPTSVATTQMRQLFVELSQAGGKVSDIFQEVAGKSFKEFVAEGGNTQDALQLLERYAADTGVGINDLFGSVEAGSAALGLTGKGTDAFGKALAEMQTSTGATQAAFETMDSGLGQGMDRLKAMWATTLLDVGEQAAPAFGAIIEAAGEVLPVLGDGLVGIFEQLAKATPTVVQAIKDVTPTIVDLAGNVGPLVTKVAGWISGFGELSPTIQGVIVVGGGLLAVLGPIIGVIGPLIPLVGSVVGAIAGLAPVVGAAGGAIALLSNPIGWIVAAVAGLALAWSQNWFGIRDKTAEVTGWISDKLSGWMEAGERAWERYGGTVLRLVSNGFGAVKSYFQTAFGYFSEIFQAGLAILRGDWSGAMEHLGNAGQIAMDGLRSLFQTGIDSVLAVLRAFNFFGLGEEKFGEIINAVRSINWGEVGMGVVQGIASGIRNGAGAIVDAARGAAQAALDAAKRWLGISSPSTVAADEIGEPFSEGVGLGARGGLVETGQEIESGLSAMLSAMRPEPLRVPVEIERAQAVERGEPGTERSGLASSLLAGLGVLARSLPSALLAAAQGLPPREAAVIDVPLLEAAPLPSPPLPPPPTPPGLMEALNRMAAEVGSGIATMTTILPQMLATAGGPSIQITQTFNGAADGPTVRRAAEDGILAGLRRAGLR